MSATTAHGPEIQLVVAYSDNRVIGRDNALPWRLRSDLAHFKRVTLGHPIIMGRKTWQSLGRPLPGRANLVISRDPDLEAEGAEVHPSLESALQACAKERCVSIIGGAQIYAVALPLAHKIIATEVHAEVEGDTWFPLIDRARWEEIERLPQAPESGLRFDFVVYRRRHGA